MINEVDRMAAMIVLLESLKANNHDFPFYVRNFHKVLQGEVGTLMGPYQMDNYELYRARMCEDNSLVKDISEIWYPKKNIRPSRFNKDKPILYCSNSVQTALSEIPHKKNGSIVNILRFKITEEIVGLTIIGLSDGQGVTFERQIDKLLNDYFTTVVKRRIEEFPDCYYPTQIFADNTKDKKFKGFIYDSVAAFQNGRNFALSPDYIDDRWEFSRLMVVEIYELKTQTDFKFKCIYYADEILNGEFKYYPIGCPGHDVFIEERIVS